MKKYIGFTFIIMVILALSLFTESVSAQTPSFQPISAELSPRYPTPGQKTTITLSSNLLALTTSDIGWYADGKLQKSGIGEKSFTFTAASGGVTITAVVVTEKNERYEYSQRVQPASVDIVWQTDSYTPPFYKGKALLPIQGTITYVAIPRIERNGTLVPASQLMYRWEKDNQLIPNGQGIGMQTIDLETSVIPRGLDVRVTVSTQDGSIKAQSRTTVAPTSPVLRVYENNPLTGVQFNHSIQGEYVLSKEEIVLEAYPYFFSIPTKDASDARNIWSINNIQSTQGSSITLRNEGVEGRSLISLKANNLKKIFQFAGSQITFIIEKLQGNAAL